ncbi:hypothetical protein [Chryseobacterium oncorhynchi]|uniref:Uncharacterized protein n=1 Tax=Chryseobacterium oncorhynchi TaxID=741074 RepID=A0A316X1A0_9FLAO|nr:hypothetical protein [Chryseobacterium oncorhynchi]PWN66476.1 hypothetical protein C1638_008960 [Chryseobacterium oncorhynchi]
MKRIVFFLMFFTIPLKAFGQQNNNKEFDTVIKQWFCAWSLVYKDLYKIDTLQPVQFVFFDDTYVYSTSSVTIPKGKLIKGYNLLNLKLNWKRAPHHNTLTLPDKSSVPVGIMSFAAEIPTDKHQSFFVMPLPSFWKKAGVESKELGLDNLTTGVFIHEFSHSQQMQSFGNKMTQYEKQNSFGVSFNDDMIQAIFSENKDYLDLYHSEINSLYTSIIDKELNKEQLLNGLNFINQRQTNYFKDKYQGLKEIDDLFLTMEGLGQYSMYLWLIHPKGGKIEKSIAMAGVRRNKKWWSQDEGFVLFLILERLKAPESWAKDMFGSKVITAIELIKANMK